MGIFSHHDTSPEEPSTFTMLRGDVFVTFTREDFAEVARTTDELEMQRLADLGWLLLDESVGPGTGPGHEEFRMTGAFTGGPGGQAARAVPVEIPPGDVTTYLLGYLKDGATGTRPE